MIPTRGGRMPPGSADPASPRPGVQAGIRKIWEIAPEISLNTASIAEATPLFSPIFIHTRKSSRLMPRAGLNVGQAIRKYCGRFPGIETAKTNVPDAFPSIRKTDRNVSITLFQRLSGIATGPFPQDCEKNPAKNLTQRRKGAKISKDRFPSLRLCAFA